MGFLGPRRPLAQLTAFCGGSSLAPAQRALRNTHRPHLQSECGCALSVPLPWSQERWTGAPVRRGGRRKWCTRRPGHLPRRRHWAPQRDRQKFQPKEKATSVPPSTLSKSVSFATSSFRAAKGPRPIRKPSPKLPIGDGGSSSETHAVAASRKITPWRVGNSSPPTGVLRTNLRIRGKRISCDRSTVLVPVSENLGYPLRDHGPPREKRNGSDP